MQVMNDGKRFIAAFAVPAAVVLIVMSAGCGSKQPAAKTAGQSKLPRVVALRDLIREGETQAKIDAANALCTFGDDASIALDDMLDLVLGRYGTRIAGRHFGNYPKFLLERGPAAKSLVPRLISVLKQPPNIEKREWYRLQLVRFAADMLRSIGPAAKEALPALEQVAMSYNHWGEEESPNDVVDAEARRSAIDALESVGADCDVFERLLESEFSDTRRQAARIMQRNCKDSIVPHRLQQMQNRKKAHE